MEKRTLTTIDQLLKIYQLNSSALNCKCRSTTEILCIENCGEPSLHCQNASCNYSYRKHKFCRKISLKGLTELLLRRFETSKPFLRAIEQKE